MSRLRTAAAWLVIASAIASLGGVALATPRATTASRRAPFTLKGARFTVLGHRLTYEVTICTPVKSVLTLTASFTPLKRGGGVRTLTPGTTQYQDHGCWPAFVSAARARKELKHCQPISCPAVIGHRYRATVTVVFAHPREVRRAPRLQAVA
jgi:hypothetical protein